MRPVLITASLVHVALTIALLAAPDFSLTLTVRRQFDDWTPLITLYRNAQLNGTGADVSLILSKALEISWCSAPLPPGTSRAPYCDCLEVQHNAFALSVLGNSSLSASTKAARDSVVMGSVTCLSARPVWRVWPVWGVYFSTPAVFVLLVTACFFWIAAGLDRRWTSIPIWAFVLVSCVVLTAKGPAHNGFWALAIVLVAILVEWVFLPGMKPHADDGDGSLPQMHLAAIDRIPSSFWWCEYLCAPVFAIYVSLIHCGRDMVMLSIMTVLGAAVGGLGLRSFWCSQVYADGPKAQFRDTMQRIVWLGIVASSLTLLSLSSVYFYDNPHFSMGVGSVALLCMTLAIGLMQWPRAQTPQWILAVQTAIALTRNLVLFALVLYDMQ
jgi:hypothetical protein